jgi:hypothetical protein
MPTARIMDEAIDEDLLQYERREQREVRKKPKGALTQTNHHRKATSG